MTTNHHLNSRFACYSVFFFVVPIDFIDPGGVWGYCGSTASRPSNPYIQTPESIICGLLQTNPCGVEATLGAYVRGLLVVLQTNPCGVEARANSAARRNFGRLQTNPCGVEAPSGSSTSSEVVCYRRTLVGSKHPRAIVDEDGTESYRRTLVGSKLATSEVQRPRRPRYRRTLVGSKLTLIGSVSLGSRLQTNPCGVEAHSTARARLLLASYRRTLVGSKRLTNTTRKADTGPLQTNPCGVEASASRARSKTRRVTDEPLWGRSR